MNPHIIKLHIKGEEEKKKQTEQVFMKLRIMGANYNLANKQGSEVS